MHPFAVHLRSRAAKQLPALALRLPRVRRKSAPAGAARTKAGESSTAAEREQTRKRAIAASGCAALLLAASLGGASCGPDGLPAFANPPPDDSGIDLEDGGDGRDAGSR